MYSPLLCSPYKCQPLSLSYNVDLGCRHQHPHGQGSYRATCARLSVERAWLAAIASASRCATPASTRLMFPSGLSSRKQCDRMRKCAATCCGTCGELSRTIFGGLFGKVSETLMRARPSAERQGRELLNVL